MAANKGVWGQAVIGLALLAVGVGMGYFSHRTLSRVEAMKSWVRTSARIVSCELLRTRGSKGGYSYEARATYRYAFGGVEHTGSRVSPHAGADNIGDFQRRTHEALMRAKDGVEAAECWVNPADPSEAVLVRSLRPELLAFMQLFVVVFGGAGLAIVLAGVAALAQPADTESPGGGQGRIRMRGSSAHGVAGALALAWNGYVGWFLWRVAMILAPEPVPSWLWLMALPGLVPAAVAGYLVARLRKFGVSVFEMAPMPGVLGGPVSGTVRIPAHVEAESGFELGLQCVHQYSSGSGKQRSTRRDVLWEETRHLDGGHAYGDETMLPVRFAVPYERPATTVPGGHNGYYWQLKVSAAAPGIDYKAVFDVPVRHTQQSSPAFAAPPAPASDASLEPVEAVVEREGLRLTGRPDGGLELVFPPGRARSAALVLVAAAAGWMAVCLLLWLRPATHLPNALAVLMAAIEGVLLAALFQAVLVTRGVRVDRARRTCTLWWSAPSLPRRERTVAFEDILEFRSEPAGRSGRSETYRVVLVPRHGAPFTVAAGMRLWNGAEDIATLLRASVSAVFERQGVRV
jgi:hypothetical protein